MTQGPFLYDDGPAPLHTGTPRGRNGLIVAVLGGTVAVAVGMAVALPLVKGSAEEQAREVSGVFLAALDAGDVETAEQLLCLAERAPAEGEDVLAGYRPAAGGEVVGTRGDEVDGEPVQQVQVRWGGGEATFTVVNEDGPRICGISAAG